MIGQTVGSYRITARLGQGGMGAVYIAEHPMLGKKAAVKVLLPELSRDPDFVQRFFNEARATALIKHPGLVDVFDYGHLPNGSAFLAMELLEGESLRARIQRRPALSLEQTVDICRQLALAVAAAHAKGIIHRDLKPDNVFLVSDSAVALGIRVKVLDFGIAKLAGKNRAELKTRTGALMGTPAYMSPEQCRGAGEVDHRTDIYAIGCILYEMLTGRPPYVGEGFGEVIAAHIYEPVPSLVGVAADVPVAAMTEVIERALAKAPEQRYQRLEDLVSALDAIASGGRSATRSAVVVGGPAAGRAVSVALPIAISTTLTGSAGEKAKNSLRSRGGSRLGRWWLVPALLSVPVIGGGATYLFAATMTSDKSGDVEAVTGAVEERRAAAPVPEPVKQALAAPVALVVKTVKLQIESVPAGAAVIRASDGASVGRTPYVEEFEAGSREVMFIVRMPGHREERIAMATERDVRRVVTLVPRPKVVKGVPKAANTSKADPKESKQSIENGYLDPFAE